MSCSPHAVEGKWVVVDECGESARAAAYHESNVASFASCNSAATWGWVVQSPSSGCRFSRRSKKDAGNLLKGGRRVVFLGDSNVRKTFYAMGRLLGAAGGGEESNDPELKHADIKLGVEGSSTHLQFIWAPLAADLVDKLNLEGGLGAGYVDALIVGGGLWDCLNEHDKFEDYEERLKLLGAKLNSIAMTRSTAVVWLSPSTVFDGHLVDEKKKELMREEDVAVYRQAQEEYLGKGGDLSLFFDSSRVTEGKTAELSADGVHYPDKVYDVFVQIILQSFDWGMGERTGVEAGTFKPKQPGEMANAGLGAMMLAFCMIGLFAFDGYMGFACFGSWMGGGPSPRDLWDEAFGELHEKLGVGGTSVRGGGGGGGEGVGGEKEKKAAEEHAMVELESGLELEDAAAGGAGVRRKDDDLDDLLVAGRARGFEDDRGEDDGVDPEKKSLL
jgi:hypothetical protein